MRVAGVQVFFFRDGAQFVDLAHAVKGNPINRLNDAWRQVCAGLLGCAGRSHCLLCTSAQSAYWSGRILTGALARRTSSRGSQRA